MPLSIFSFMTGEIENSNRNRGNRGSSRVTTGVFQIFMQRNHKDSIPCLRGMIKNTKTWKFRTWRSSNVAFRPFEYSIRTSLPHPSYFKVMVRRLLTPTSRTIFPIRQPGSFTRRRENGSKADFFDEYSKYISGSCPPQSLGFQADAWYSGQRLGRDIARRNRCDCDTSRDCDRSRRPSVKTTKDCGKTGGSDHWINGSI